MHKVVVAIGSVLAVLLSSNTAFAYSDAQVAKILILSQRDSATLMGRMKFPLRQEYNRNSPLLTRRFQTSDRAIRIDCGQHQDVKQNYAVVCAVTLDPSKSKANVSQIAPGYIEKAITFKVLASNDVSNMLTNMVYTAGTFYTSDNVIVNNDRYKNITIPRFYYSCPRDWVFDVVSCEGHIILR